MNKILNCKKLIEIIIMQKKELVRKLIHLLFGIIILGMIYFLGIPLTSVILFTGLIIGTIVSIALSKKINIPILGKIVAGVERENEKTFPGKAAILFFISAILVMVIFKDTPSIVLASISVQVFADSAAALIGINFGKHKLYKKKTIEGSTACLIVAIICINFFFPLHIAIIGGVIATIVELLPLDDNLFVPLFTAIAIKGLLL